MPAALGRLSASQPDGWQEHYEPVDRHPGHYGLQTPRPNHDSTSQSPCQRAKCSHNAVDGYPPFEPSAAAPAVLARPVQAAVVSAFSSAVRAALPLTLIVLAPIGVRVPVTALAALALLALLGAIGARVGRVASQLGQAARLLGPGGRRCG